MDNVMNPVDRVEVHFPAGHPYSCGDSLSGEQTLNLAEVTCTSCRSQYFWLVDAEGIRRRRGEELAQRIRTAIEEGRWDAMLDAARDLYEHEVPERAASDARDALRRIERRLRHGIYSTSVGAGMAVIMCDCGWNVEMGSLGECRVEHRAHAAGER